MNYQIGGIQQVGVGLTDLDTSMDWWRELFGFDCPVFRDRGIAKLMTHYTRGTAEERDAALVFNLRGGSGLELWQYISRTPQPPAAPTRPGDLGIYAAKIRCPDISTAHTYLSQHALGAQQLAINPIHNDPTGAPSFFCRDHDGNVIQVIETPAPLNYSRHPLGGVCGAIIGTSDIDSTQTLYASVLGYSQVVSDTTLTFPAPNALTPAAGTKTIRSVILTQPNRGKTPFARLYGPSTIELWQSLSPAPATGSKRTNIFSGRQWGDIGYIHLCFEVRGTDAVQEKLQSLGRTLTVDSADTFDMGDGAGRFSYFEDDDGTLIELVETHRLQISKKPPISFNVQNRRNPLSKLMLRALTMTRTRK